MAWNRILGCFALGLFALGAAGFGQGTEPDGTERTESGDYVDYTFKKEGISLKEAVEWATRDTKRSFKYNDNEFQNKPNLILTGQVRILRTRSYEFWQSLFLTANFAMVPMGPGEGDFIQLELIDTSRILKQRAVYVPVEELDQYRYRVGEVIMTTITLQHVKVDNVRGAVQQIFANRSAEFANEVPTANAIIVVGFGPTIYAVNQILRAMDVPSAVQTLRFEKIPLEHAVAEEIQPIITDLIATGQGNASLVRAGTQGAPGQPIIPGQEKPEPKLLSDTRSNSLVVYAVESDMSEIKRLVAALDTPTTEIESNIRIYVLKNTNARDIERTLRDVLQQGTSRSTRGPQGAQGNATVGGTTDDVVIVADENTNTLLIQATRTRYDQIKPIIDELDRRRPQVLVETAIVELSETDLRSIAVELTAVQQSSNSFNPAFGTGFGLSSIGTLAGAPTDGTFQGLRRVPFGFGSADGASFNGLVAGLFDNDLNIPILVQLLQTYQRSNLLSNASVLTSDNQQASIAVGRTVFTQQLTTTNAGNDLTRADQAEAELRLTISPHISSDDYLRLDIELIVDAFQGSFDPASGIPPPTTNREYRGTVTIQNGKTVVIGGLVQQNDGETENKVPFLGDIPLLGELFKSTSRTKENTTLYLFVTPTIITEFSTLDDLSYERKLEVQKLQGAIDLVDKHFRAVRIEEVEIDLDAIDSSGLLDVPRFNPVSGLDEQALLEEVRGAPVSPRPTGDDRAKIRDAGTIEFRGGRPSGTSPNRPR